MIVLIKYMTHNWGNYLPQFFATKEWGLNKCVFYLVSF